MMSMKEITIEDIDPFIRALHCPTRWKIIESLQKESQSSEQIYNFLDENGIKLQKAAFYYHLRELEAAGFIELDEFKPSEKKRAPEKVWKLKIKKLLIKFSE